MLLECIAYYTGGLQARTHAGITVESEGGGGRGMCHIDHAYVLGRSSWRSFADDFCVW